MTTRKLRVATDGDAPPKPKSLIEAAAGGDYREMLVAQRHDIARSLQDPDTKGPARAALHRQLSLVAKELRMMDDAAGVDDPVSRAAAVPDEAWQAQ